DARLFRRTLKRTRKFVVEGVQLSVTTSKIIGEDEKKDEEMRFLRAIFVFNNQSCFFSLLSFSPFLSPSISPRPLHLSVLLPDSQSSE
ncbi:serine/threonine-protein kinase 10, partial [Tachysurus ichikawai]